jgi:putative DNA methylase
MGGDQHRKKLIEVALPLEAINIASVREKSIRHGHPSTLHLWWARRPLAACRAVIFGQLVDDPSSVSDEFPSEEAQRRERQRLFQIVERLVKWENSDNQQVLHEARLEIVRNLARDKKLPFNPKMSRAECLAFLRENAPPVLDPFCGGGSIPLEAQRLGLKVHASDLNPVAVLITKALIEIPPKFSDKPPVNPEARRQTTVEAGGWTGVLGLAEDVRYYGSWMRDEAEKRIGHLYPKAKLPTQLGGGEAPIIAWLWARTVKCPNPACGAQMPLVRSFVLATRTAKQSWLRPVIDRGQKTVHFSVKVGTPSGEERVANSMGTSVSGEGRRSKAKFRCIVCEQGIADGAYIDAEATEHRMGMAPLAIVAERERGRTYLPFTSEAAAAIQKASHSDLLNIQDRLPSEHGRGTFAGNAQGRYYGFTTFSDYYTSRQLVALSTFVGLIAEAMDSAQKDALASGFPNDGKGIEDGGTGARAYAEAIGTYLAFVLSRQADLCNSLNPWEPIAQCPRHLFARQGISMVWDFAEGNPLGGSSGSWNVLIENMMRSLKSPGFNFYRNQQGGVKQLDAAVAIDGEPGSLITTDPPYYNNIGYADLADFFYVWLRRSLSQVYPSLFSTVLTPKRQELVASPYRFDGDKGKAREFFEGGLRQAFGNIRSESSRASPLAIFYAFKQVEFLDDDYEGQGSGVVSTGWETMLQSLLDSGFQVVGTWPMRTEMSSRLIGHGTNVLASSIVLATRPRVPDAPMATRQQFMSDLSRTLPDALRKLQQGSVAPVDLQQAAIGPGIAVFSQYAKVMEASGGVMTVRTSLQAINQVRDQVLSEQETELDDDTRWCLSWFKQYGMDEGPYGEAEVLSRALNTAVNGLVAAGLIRAEKGMVRLRRREELSEDYDPREDPRPTVWKATQYLARALGKGGEVAAADLARPLGSLGELAKELAYLVFEICNRKGWTQEGIPFNSLVAAWPEISHLARAGGLEEFGLEV